MDERKNYAISLSDFKEKIKNGSTVLDSRDAHEFCNGFIPGSLFVGNNPKEIISLVEPKQSVVLLTSAGQDDPLIKLFASHFSIEGFLEGGFKEWTNASEKVDMVIEIEADELAMDIHFDKQITVMDIRKRLEFSNGHIKDATNLPLQEMTNIALIAQFEEDEKIYIYSNDDEQSVLAASILKKHGYHNLRIVSGGWQQIQKEKSIHIIKEPNLLN